MTKHKPSLTKGQLILGVGFVLLFIKAIGVTSASNFIPEGFISIGGITDLLERFRR